MRPRNRAESRSIAGISFVSSSAVTRSPASAAPSGGRDQPDGQEIAPAHRTDFTHEHGLDAFPLRQLQRQRLVQRRIRVNAHAPQRGLDRGTLDETHDARLHQIDAEPFGDRLRDRRIRRPVGEVGQQDRIPGVEHALRHQRACEADAENTQTHVARGDQRQTRDRESAGPADAAPREPARCRLPVRTLTPAAFRGRGGHDDGQADDHEADRCAQDPVRQSQLDHHDVHRAQNEQRADAEQAHRGDGAAPRTRSTGGDAGRCERSGEGCRGCMAIRRQRRERFAHRAVQIGGHIGPERRDVGRRLGDAPRDHRQRVLRSQRRLPGQHLEEHAPQRVHITSRVQRLLADGLLGTHVERCSRREAGLRQPRTARFVDRDRDPEVRDHCHALVQQDVLGLDVAVDHTVAVRVVQGRGDLPRQLRGVFDREPAFTVQANAQRLALHHRHHVIEEPVGLARIVQRQDVRMIEPGRDPDLAQEPFGAEHGRQLRPQHLERDPAVVPQVLGQVDRCHAALAELPLDAVAIGEGGRQPFGDGTHRRSIVSLPAGGTLEE